MAHPLAVFDHRASNCNHCSIWRLPGVSAMCSDILDRESLVGHEATCTLVDYLRT